MIPVSIWRSVAEKFWLACLVAGTFFMIVGATGTVPFISQQVVEVYFQILIFVSGLALIGFSVYAGMAAREVDPGKGPPGEPRSNKINPKAYGVLIATPKEGAETVPPVEIEGTIKAKLGDLELWLVNVSEISGAPGYWPQRQVYPDNKNKWSVTYTPLYFENGERRRLRLYFVGKDGQALMTAYRRINDEFAAPNKLRWVGLTKLTADMVPACDPLQIILRRPPEPDERQP
jgi:hypothetical protein